MKTNGRCRRGRACDQPDLSPAWRTTLPHFSHLRRILSAYAAYYNQARIHLALQKDTPLRRAGVAPLSPFRSWLGCITNTSGYDFWKGQLDCAGYDMPFPCSIFHNAWPKKAGSGYLPRTNTATSVAKRLSSGSTSGSSGFLNGIGTLAPPIRMIGASSQSNATSPMVDAISPVTPNCR